jgi:hypothetical protein
MVQFLILILVAIIVSQDVEVLKGLKDWVIQKQWEEGKIAIPMAIVVGIIAGLALNIGITEAIISMTGIEFTLPKLYTYFDLASTCLFLSRGAAFFVDTIEKFNEIRSQVDK